ncbi:MAG: RNA polymerase sigma factor, partial [bacterium]
LVARDQVDLDLLLQSAAKERQAAGDLENEKQYKLGIIDRCLERIGKNCRQLIQLREKQEMSYVEIGKALKIPMGTVMSRLSRCKKALKVMVEQFLKES